jgi:hypothetical protein
VRALRAALLLLMPPPPMLHTGYARCLPRQVIDRRFSQART